VSSKRDTVFITVAIVGLALGAFAVGWWTGHADAMGGAQEARIAALEQRAQAPVRVENPRAAAVAPAQPARKIEVKVEGAPTQGPADAPVMLVEFSDFQCPFCARVNPTLTQLKEEYGDQVRFVFKHFPLSIHPQAMAAHKASVAAAEQGKFWEMHDRIFANQRALDRATLVGYATDMDLDVAAFETALDSPEVQSRIDADMADGRDAGVRGTPAFVINGKLISGAQPYTAFKAEVDRALADVEESEKG